MKKVFLGESNKFKYELITADDFFCVAALLQMIISCCTNIKLDQYQIADYFGLWVPIDYKKAIKINNVRRTDDSNFWGIVIEDNEVNEFFQHFNIPLREEYISINSIAEWNFEDRITEYLSENYHLICGYDYNSLYNKGYDYPIGHVSLISGISKDKNIIMIDPGPYKPGIKEVKSEDLYVAIKRKNNGIWKIKRI